MSILQEEGEVSKTICHCSLGHIKIFWEAALGMELEGEIESSALNGDYLCKFIIRPPDECENTLTAGKIYKFLYGRILKPL